MNDPMFPLAMVICWCMVNGLIGGMIGGSRGSAGAGALLGIVLGPIGWLVAFLCCDNRPRCPECGGRMVEGARRCKCCGVEIKRTELRVEPKASPTVAPPPRPSPVWCAPVRCPICDAELLLTEGEILRGVICAKCGHGFVAQPAKRARAKV